MVESGIGLEGEGVAEKEVARGRSSRGLMMVSFCSIVCSLVAGSSALRGRWLASLHTSARRVPGALASRGAGANSALAACRLAEPCVYNNACKYLGCIHILPMMRYKVSRCAIIPGIPLSHHSIHSQTKMGAGKRRRARPDRDLFPPFG